MGLELLLMTFWDIPQLYGDHAFLINVLTDGEENRSTKFTAYQLESKIRNLGENFTISILVPDQRGVYEAKKFGFPAGNIAVWETTERGLQEGGAKMAAATTSYYAARSAGVRGTRKFYDVAVGNLNTQAVKNQLEELNPTQYALLPVRKKAVIKEFVESWFPTVPYRPGCAFFPLTKAEKVQNYKQIIVQEKASGKIYSGAMSLSTLGTP